ncbi:MAG TPA: NUDIX domain-containing protein [Solirubrobacteraceae bacterium]|nr:NUDIX domain-containing protein [Solirubrobacteraceae bacterium]
MTAVRKILARLSRSPPARQVVAAVPVRARAAGSVEFLLVRTSNGERWTFPKGGRESGETLAEAATREAIEEAGAVGRIGPEPIGEYLYRGARVVAFLLEVECTQRPAEAARGPQWFALEEARSRLSEGRDEAFAEQMKRVLLAAQRSAGGVR